MSAYRVFELDTPRMKDWESAHQDLRQQLSAGLSRMLIGHLSIHVMQGVRPVRPTRLESYLGPPVSLLFNFELWA